MSITAWIGIAVVLVTVWALIKRYETKLVLILGLYLFKASRRTGCICKVDDQ